MTVTITPVDHGTVPGDATGEGAFYAFQSINANEANIKAAIELLQGRHWLTIGGTSNADLGKRYKASNHSGFAITMPATFAGSETDLNDVWVWNADNASDVTLTPSSGDSFYVDGVGLGVDTTQALSPGEVCFIDVRTDNSEWDLVIVGSGGGLSATADESITGLWNFTDNGGGDLDEYDVTIGDVTTPDYGIVRIGDSIIGRTSHVAIDGAPAYELNGAFVFQNPTGPVTGDIEFGFLDSSGLLRFGLPKSAVGNATYNPRSMLLAGPAIADSDIVTVGYWQGVGIFDNLTCDTSGSGADLGVQNDLEVEGQIFTDTITESTTDAGVTIEGVKLEDGDVYTAVGSYTSGVASGASAIAFDFDTDNNYTHAGAELARWSNNSVIRFRIQRMAES